MSKFNSVVTNIAQDFTAAEKAQGRANIDAAAISSAFDASGNLVASGEITFDPDSIYVGGDEVMKIVQSDWTQTSATEPDYIKNKPLTTSCNLRFGDYANHHMNEMWFDLRDGKVTFGDQALQDSDTDLRMLTRPEPEDDGKIVTASGGVAVWTEAPSPIIGQGADWTLRFSSEAGANISTNKISTYSIDTIGDSTEIWGTATINFVTSGSYALCPADVTTELTEADQCLNLKDISAGIHSFDFCFKADNPGDIRYLEIKGQAGKTASDVNMLYLATQNKRSV